MSLELLLDQFDHVIQTAADVEKLRGLILQLATQGKLESQDINDEPASILLEKNIALANRLIQNGEIKKQKPLPPIPPKEPPYILPVNWVWCRLGDITNYGISDKAEASQVAHGTWLLELGDVESGTSRVICKRRFGEETFASTKNIFQEGDVLYGKLRPYLDKVVVADEPGVCTTEMIPIRGYVDIDPHYLRLCLKRPDFIAYANSKTYGMNLPRLGTEDARKALIPLAPYQEQKRIVSKVDELFQQTQQLAQRLQSADHRRRRFHTAALYQLTTAPTPAAATAAWNHLAPHFHQLYTDPEAITQLKQAILHLAVSGRLVPQDPNDEPAAVLLERIAAEKNKLKDGNSQKDDLLLPTGWAWTKIGVVADHRLGKMLDKQKNTGDFRPYLRNLNVQWLHIDLTDLKEMRIAESEIEELILRPGDLLICEGGEPGRAAIWENSEQVMFFQKALHRVRPLCGIQSKYLLYHIWSDAMSGNLAQHFTGATIKHFTGKALQNYVIALPPVQEQIRIVNSIDDHFTLCDQLAKRVVSAETARQHLLNALLTP